MYGLRRSTRIQKDFTNSVMPSVDYVSGRGLLWWEARGGCDEV